MGLTTQTYDILTRVAVGNGALVYRAVEKSTLRQVALKLLSQDGELDHRFDLEALFAAAPLLKQITGSHVCQLLDAYEDEDGPVLVYEFAAGLNGTELPRERKLTAQEALDVAAQVISALRSGERQRIPHGDLKPANFVFAEHPEGRPFTLVLDWNLAAFRPVLVDDSLSYLSPERLDGLGPSHLGDLFSAGAVLFYLFTGKVLVAGNTTEEVLEAWKTARPELLGEMRPDLPPRLVQWVCSLLALDPAARPVSAVEAGTALAALNPPPPLAPPESIRPRPAPVRQAPVPVPVPVESSVSRPVAVASGVRAAPVSAGMPRPNLQTRATPHYRAPEPKPHAGLIATLSVIFIAASAAGAWWFLSDKKPAVTVKESEGFGPPRTPAPSVLDPVKNPAPDPAEGPGKPVASAVPGPGSQALPPPLQPIRPGPAPVRPEAVAKLPANMVNDPVFIARESFEYPGGTALELLSGGGGWTGPWHGAATIDATSLNFPPHPVSGGSLTIPAGDEVVLSRSLGPLSRFITPGVGGHWYFSALVRHSDDTPAPAFEVRFNPFNTKDIHNLIQIVVVDSGSEMNLTLNQPQPALTVKDTGKPLFFVAQITLSNPKFDLWDVQVVATVTPVISAKSFSTDKALRANMKGVRVPAELGLMIRKKRSNATTTIDEIRFGRHWEEMVFRTPPDKPEPTPAPGDNPPAPGAPATAAQAPVPEKPETPR